MQHLKACKKTSTQKATGHLKTITFKYVDEASIQSDLQPRADISEQLKLWLHADFLAQSNTICMKGIVAYSFLSIAGVIHKAAIAENELQKSTSGGVDGRVSRLWESAALAPGPEQDLLLKSKKVKFTTGASQSLHHEKRLSHARASNMISQ